MPWVVAAKLQADSGPPPDPENIAWIEENPWFFQYPDIKQAAFRYIDEMLTLNPSLTKRDQLKCVVTGMREAFPDRVPDTGFLVQAGGLFVNAVPRVPVEQLAAERPFTLRLPADDGQRSDAMADRVWFLPLQSPAVPTPTMLADLVAALDAGGSACLVGATEGALKQARNAIQRMLGFAGRA